MKNKNILKWLRFTVLVLISIVFLFPIVWIIFTSLKTDLEVRGAVSLFPKNPQWQNYIDSWKSTNFGRPFLNSFIMSISVTLGQIFTSALAGYS